MAQSHQPKSLRIGVMMENIQLSDIVGIDLFYNLAIPDADMMAAFVNSGESMAPVAASLAKFRGHFMDVKFFYIATSLEPAPASPTIKWLPNTTYDDCPRDLDIVITGGPLPAHRPPQAERFMKEAFTKTRVWLTTCTGSMWLASSGMLNGKQATTNRMFLPLAKVLYPEVEWLDQRWVIQDKEYDGEGKGELWTSGGAGSGMDMIGNYLLANFDPDFVRTASFQGADLDPARPRGQFYEKI